MNTLAVIVKLDGTTDYREGSDLGRYVEWPERVARSASYQPPMLEPQLPKIIVHRAELVRVTYLYVERCPPKEPQ